MSYITTARTIVTIEKNNMMHGHIYVSWVKKDIFWGVCCDIVNVKKKQTMHLISNLYEDDDVNNNKGKNKGNPNG